MRDLLIVLPVFVGSLMALRKPWIGVLVWTWLSIMNPHRLTYGFAYSAPLAATAAGCTLVGLVLTSDHRASPFKGPATIWFTLYVVWFTISWRFGMDPVGDTEQYSKVIKMCLFVFVALSLLNTKKQIMAMTWVVTMSLAILGAKGGLFTVLTGGSHKVLGPPGSLLDDNNHFATALAMTVPLVRYLQMQVANRWLRRLLGAMMVLCAAASLGSYSRGALLAVSAMVLVLWWRGKNRMTGGVLIALGVVGVVALMPDAWKERMNSIKTHDQDASAQGRINAWIMAWNAAQHHLVGLGFITYKPEYFAMYSPNPDAVFAAHSIYFQVLGSHGFIGLFLFLGMLYSIWSTGGWLRKHAADIPQARWAYDLGSLCQVSLVAYVVGGTFLSLAQFDLPYNLLAILAAARIWVQTRGWEREEAPPLKSGKAAMKPARAA